MCHPNADPAKRKARLYRRRERKKGGPLHERVMKRLVNRMFEQYAFGSARSAGMWFPKDPKPTHFTFETYTRVPISPALATLVYSTEKRPTA